MANEHTLNTQVTIPVTFTVSDSTGIEKGTVLKATDPKTAAASAGANDIVAGIAYTEKIANDGNTQLAVVRGPGDRFIATASGSVSIGDPLGTSATANMLQSIAGTSGLSGSKRVGYALETVSTGETFLYELNIGSGP